jgi:hypothetical protein
MAIKYCLELKAQEILIMQSVGKQQYLSEYQFYAMMSWQ